MLSEQCSLVNKTIYITYHDALLCNRRVKNSYEKC